MSILKDLMFEASDDAAARAAYKSEVTEFTKSMEELKKYLKAHQKFAQANPYGKAVKQIKAANGFLDQAGSALSLSMAESIDLSEAKKEYTDSGEFTDELSTAAGHVEDMKKILVSLRWKNWMRETDKNFGTRSAEENRKTFEAFKKFEDSFLKLATVLETAGE